MSPIDLRKAERFIEEGRTEEALALLDGFSKRFPAYVTARLLTARALERSGDRSGAAEAWRGLRALMPSNAAVINGFRRFFGTEVGALVYGYSPADDADPSPPDGEVERQPDDETGNHDTSELFTGQDEAAESAQPAGTYSIDTLDDLIYQLENAPRITPAPSHAPGDEEDDFRPEPHDDEIVSETLARIYVTQKQFSEAARVYDRLSRQHPDRAEEFSAKARECRTKANA